jgi:hypothetical protein
MHLSGQLSDWSINDLLQIMQVTKKTGSLDIEGERRGRVHFVDGSVTGAELSGAKGNYQASGRGAIADILFVLSTLDSGTFAVGDADGPDRDGLAVEDLMGEVATLRALESEVIDAGLIEATGVRLLSQVDEPITMQPADWEVITSLVQPFTFDHLEARLGRGGAVRILHALHRLGVAEAIAGDDESEWLDQLAGGLAAESSEPTWLEEMPAEGAAKHLADKWTAEPVPTEEFEVGAEKPEPVPVAELEPEPEPEPEVEADIVRERVSVGVRGVSADASTTLTDGVYDEIRRLRSKVAEK